MDIGANKKDQKDIVIGLKKVIEEIISWRNSNIVIDPLEGFFVVVATVEESGISSYRISSLGDSI